MKLCVTLSICGFLVAVRFISMFFPLSVITLVVGKLDSASRNIHFPKIKTAQNKMTHSNLHVANHFDKSNIKMSFNNIKLFRVYGKS